MGGLQKGFRYSRRGKYILGVILASNIQFQATNFWAGNDLINVISSKDSQVVLRVDLWGDRDPNSPHKNDYWWSEFYFRLDDESTDYTLHVETKKRNDNDWTGTGNARWVKQHGFRRTEGEAGTY